MHKHFALGPLLACVKLNGYLIIGKHGRSLTLTIASEMVKRPIATRREIKLEIFLTVSWCYKTFKTAVSPKFVTTLTNCLGRWPDDFVEVATANAIYNSQVAFSPFNIGAKLDV